MNTAWHLGIDQNTYNWQHCKWLVWKTQGLLSLVCSQAGSSGNLWIASFCWHQYYLNTQKRALKVRELCSTCHRGVMLHNLCYDEQIQQSDKAAWNEATQCAQTESEQAYCNSILLGSQIPDSCWQPVWHFPDFSHPRVPQDAGSRTCTTVQAAAAAQVTCPSVPFQARRRLEADLCSTRCREQFQVLSMWFFQVPVCSIACISAIGTRSSKVHVEGCSKRQTWLPSDCAWTRELALRQAMPGKAILPDRRVLSPPVHGLTNEVAEVKTACIPECALSVKLGKQLNYLRPAEKTDVNVMSFWLS